MVGISGLVVVSQVAPNTGIGSGIVISVVTLRTVVGNGNVGSCKHIIVAVCGEGSRRPVGIGGMTGHAVCWYINGWVIGIQRGVVVGQMASLAGIGSIVITTGMTGNTVPGNGSMRPGKRVGHAMIEG